MNALFEIARFGLPSAADEPIAVDIADASLLLTGIANHRLTGVAVDAMETGALVLDDDTAADLVTRHDAAMTQTLRAELAMLRVVEALRSAGLSFRILKGSALAHTVALAPWHREFRDVDLLVPATEVDDAVRCIGSIGGTRLQPELRPGFDRRFAKSVTMKLDGIEIDVHRTLAPGPFGTWIHPSELFVLPSSFQVAGESIDTLDATDHLVHACYHVALGQNEPALTNLRDVALLEERTAWDSQRFDEIIERWNGRAAIARAVALVSDQLRCQLGERLEAYTYEPGDEELLAPYLVNGDRFPGLATATMRALPKVDSIAFARAVGFPDGTNRAERVRELLRQRRKLYGSRHFRPRSGSPKNL